MMGLGGAQARALGNRAECRLLVAAPLWVEALLARSGLRGARVVRTGMGPRRSVRAAARLETTRANAMAVVGLCGSLDPRVRPGDLVVATELRGQGKPHELPWAEPLASILRARGRVCLLGPVVSTANVVRGARRQALGARGALAVDMESWWLAAGSRERPLVVLRAVLDGPLDELAAATFVRNLGRALRSLRAAIPALGVWHQALGVQ